MIRLLILFLGFSITTFGQSKLDYDIYSLLINRQIVDWKMKEDTILQLVVTNTLSKYSLDMTDMIEELKTKDNYFAYTYMHFYDKKVDMLNNNEFRLLIDDLKLKLNSSTDLRADSFKLKIPVKIEPHWQIEKRFDKKTIKGFDRAWKKFYKKYRTSPGYFEFSKVVYTEHFAVVYVVRRAKPLVGSGGLEILTYENGIWKKLAYYSMWNN